MSIRNLTKVPKLSLVYFSVDQSTCVVETKKLRRKDTGESNNECPPEKMDAVTIRSESKQPEAFIWLLLQMVGPSIVTIGLFLLLLR